MKSKKLLTLTAAAALAISSVPMTSAMAQGTNSGDVQCFGVNSCKGAGACKTATNDCKGKNGCKGKGFTTMSADDCTKAGGTTTQK